MSATTFNIEEFNDSTKVLWDEAYRRGYRQGEEDTTSKLARQQAVSMLEVAKVLLDQAGPRELAIARMVLGRTPLVHRSIDVALAHVRTDPIKAEEPTAERARMALGSVTEALEALS